MALITRVHITSDRNCFDTIILGLSGLLSGVISDGVDSSLQALSYGYKTSLNVVVASGHLLYDIFLAGVSSPINLIMNMLLTSLSYVMRHSGKTKTEVLAQDNYDSDTKGPPPGPESKRNPKHDTISRKKNDDTDSLHSPHPTTYSYNSSSIPTKVAGALLKKNPVPLLIMAVPVQSKLSIVHETPQRSLIRSIFRTVCLCLTILALSPISQFDRFSARNILSNLQGGEVLNSLKLKSHAVGASIARLLDNWFNKNERSKDFAATPEFGPDLVHRERYDPQTHRGCPFLKKSRS